jgi:hypothetical protein
MFCAAGLYEKLVASSGAFFKLNFSVFGHKKVLGKGKIFWFFGVISKCPIPAVTTVGRICKFSSIAYETRFSWNLKQSSSKPNYLVPSTVTFLKYRTMLERFFYAKV